jgi:hypothetical protein
VVAGGSKWPRYLGVDGDSMRFLRNISKSYGPTTQWSVRKADVDEGEGQALMTG